MIKMEIIEKFENRNGQIDKLSINKPKPLAIPIFMAKLRKYANKNHKITYFFCDDPQFLGLISNQLPANCEITMIKETS